MIKEYTIVQNLNPCHLKKIISVYMADIRLL